MQATKQHATDRLQISIELQPPPVATTSIFDPKSPHMNAHRVHDGVLHVGEGDQSGQRKCERVTPATKILDDFPISSFLSSQRL